MRAWRKLAKHELSVTLSMAKSGATLSPTQLVVERLVYSRQNLLSVVIERLVYSRQNLLSVVIERLVYSRQNLLSVCSPAVFF